MRLDTILRPRIELALGRQLGDAEYGRIRSFDAVAASDIADFRTISARVGRLAAIAYIRHCVTGAPLQLAVNYMCEVVEQEMCYADWAKRNAKELAAMSGTASA